MIGDLFATWTPYGVVVAIVSGLAMSEVTRRLSLFRSARQMAWSLYVVGLFWYIPVWLRTATDPDLAVANFVRNSSAGLLWAGIYVASAVVWRWLLERKEER
jgi:multisubunit Na+/H+ antiporter MnhE subunit